MSFITSPVMARGLSEVGGEVKEEPTRYGDQPFTVQAVKPFQPAGKTVRGGGKSAHITTGN